MKSITFNKKEDTVLCIQCKRNAVSSRRWDKPCDECRSKNKNKKVKSVEMGIGKRFPAAVWENEDGDQIFVDKFGKPVDDHGYDLANDPRGYKKTGTVKSKKEIII